jgi:hypothetical protein
MCFVPDADDPATVFVAEDVDRDWDDLGPHLMHDVLGYAAWNPGEAGRTASISSATTVEELRAAGTSHRVLSVDEAVDFVRGGRLLALHPLIGGLPPDLAWRYLHTAADALTKAAS